MVGHIFSKMAANDPKNMYIENIRYKIMFINTCVGITMIVMHRTDRPMRLL